MKRAGIPRSLGHIFSDRLQKPLSEAGFGASVEQTCKSMVGRNFKARTLRSAVWAPPKITIAFALTLAALVSSGTCSKAEEVLSYSDLVTWLTDFERLALLPVSGERTGLASSYDRASQYDAVHDRYLAWGANRDADGIVRHEEDGDVLADLKGPGALVRIWSANAGPGSLKLFFDGDQTPLLEAPFIRFFNHSLPPFVWPNLVYTAGENVPGFNNYVPIPFKRSLKIVANPNWGSYYQFTYVQLPQTEIASFAIPISREAQTALAKANHRLGSPDFVASKQPAGASPYRTDTVVEGGATKGILDIAGPAAITRLRVKLNLPKDIAAQRRLLRELVIRVTWDNDATPSIWSPIGDFFGFFGGAKTFKAYPLGIGRDGFFYSNWYMPFAARAKIEIVNDGSDKVPIHCEITTAGLRFPVSAYGRFHAKWHRDAFLPVRPDRKPDWTVLATHGRGRYVGLHLHVWNPGWRLVGGGRRKILRRRGKVSVRIWNRIRRLFRVRLVESRPLLAAFSQSNIE